MTTGLPALHHRHHILLSHPIHHPARYVYKTTSIFITRLTMLQINPLVGSHAVRYQPGSAWDCVVESGSDSIDVALTLPHFRARHQPADHRLNMLIATRSSPIRAQIVRHLHSSIVRTNPDMINSAEHLLLVRHSASRLSQRLRSPCTSPPTSTAPSH